MIRKEKLFIISIITLVGVLLFVFYPRRSSQEKPDISEVGLWDICNPQTNNCEDALVCKQQGASDIYRCINYLKEGEECGISVAEICGEDLVCTETNQTRERCGTFSTEGEQECFIEPFEVCK